MADEVVVETSEEVDIIDVPADNARDLTSALVMTTFGLSVLALVFMLYGLGKWYAVGPFKPH